jgi:hypothetical protein
VTNLPELSETLNMTLCISDFSKITTARNIRHVASWPRADSFQDTSRQVRVSIIFS